MSLHITATCDGCCQAQVAIPLPVPVLHVRDAIEDAMRASRWRQVAGCWLCADCQELTEIPDTEPVTEAMW